MHGVNLDLLRASAPCHPDGRPKDPHAHHRAEHLAARQAARALRRQSLLLRLISLFPRPRLGRKVPATGP